MSKNKNNNDKYNTINMNMLNMCFSRSCPLGKYFSNLFNYMQMLDQFLACFINQLGSWQ